MSYGNVPDDWGSFFTNCSRCGGRYHASEGGCGCMDDLECQCGSNDWDGEEEPRCSKCSTGPHEEGRRHSKQHRARKTYDEGKSSEIRPGDLYRRTVNMGYFPGGARTLSVKRYRIEKGPAWEDEGVAA